MRQRRSLPAEAVALPGLVLSLTGSGGEDRVEPRVDLGLGQERHRRLLVRGAGRVGAGDGRFREDGQGAAGQGVAPGCGRGWCPVEGHVTPAEAAAARKPSALAPRHGL
jgi:hypothetical protein